MSREHCATLYDLPSLYDAVVKPGPCASFYRKLACSTGGPILELACGTGRLTIPLALDGHEVVGLDASYPMLSAARAKAEAKRAKVEFVLGDMCRFDLGRYFALVIVSCNSLAHMTANEDIVECLSRIARHLVPGGLLAFDVVNPNVRDLAQCGHTAERSETEPDRSYVSGSKELISYDPVQQVQILRWRFEALGRKIPPVARCACAPIFRRRCRCALPWQVWNSPPDTVTSTAAHSPAPVPTRFMQLEQQGTPVDMISSVSDQSTPPVVFYASVPVRSKAEAG
ncbi:class I SAM-dependent methyltransferase [Mesorhizobium sp. WSM2561]|uniref:class I SAM-dependent methyltransferase n=1 Tax=Mesorhizobium sp. WSM2561 TaxID=1040985 RepID=UPI0004809559|nr:class I SAM-dependent methyltransferase [Mesorhizobium sp. WSM2561]